jgi:hypothetical protein
MYQKTGPRASQFVLLHLTVLLLTGCSGGSGAPPPADGGADPGTGETWSKSFGGPQDDEAHAVAATRDGGFVFVGTSDAGVRLGADANGGDFWLNKLDAGGNPELERVFGVRRLFTPDGDTMTFKRARATADGGYVLVGSVGSHSPPYYTDIAVARLDRFGAVVWARGYDSGAWLQYGYDTARGTHRAEAADVGVDVALAADGYWIVATSSADLVDTRGLGLAPFSGAESTVVLRLDSDGDATALNRLTDAAYERAYYRYPPLIRGTADGGAALARARSFGGQPMLAVQKLAPDGALLWTRELDEIARPTDLIQTTDAGFLLSAINDPSGSAIVAKLTAAGDIEWSDVFNDPDVIDVTSYPRISINGVAQWCNGSVCGYAAAGGRVSDEGAASTGYVVLMDSGGALIRERYMEGVTSALSIDGGSNGAPLRVLARGNGDRVLSEGGALLTLEPASLATLVSRTFELGERGTFDASLAPVGPLMLATSDQRLTQFDSAAMPTLQTVLRESGSRTEVATSVVELAAGRYVIAGRSRSFTEIEAGAGGTRAEAWVLRFDSGSGLVWQKRLAPGLRGEVSAMAASTDGGVVLIGELFGALRAVKLDADGRLQWQSAPLLTAQNLTGASLSEIHRTADPGYLVLGSPGDSTSVVVKLDAAGAIQWSRAYDAGVAQSLHPTADGGSVMSASAGQSGALALVRKLAANGEPQWSYEYSFLGGNALGTSKVRQSQDGGYLLGLTETGVTSDADAQGNAIPRGQTNVLLLKLDADGGVTWSRSYGALLDEWLTDVQALADGGFVIAGWSDSLGDGREAWLLRLGPDGFVNGGSCNAYLGAIAARLFGLRIPEARPAPLLAAIAEGTTPTITSVQDTGESARDASAHVVARQCLGPVTNIVEGTPSTPSSFRLALEFSGQGSGSVRSDPALLECTAACAADFPARRLVVLDATPAADSAFAGWENCGSVEGRRCFLLMNEPREPRVRFEPSRPALVVSLAGTGSGLVTSSVAGISCGADCREDYLSGTSVVLTAAPDDTSSFLGWTGCDSTDRQFCTVLVDRRREVSAEFNRLSTQPTVELRVEMHPESRGIGSITSSPSLVSCQVEFAFVQPNTGGPCAYEVPSGGRYTVFANPEPGTPTTFVSWSGCDSTPPTNACEVTMDTARTVRPRFSAP